MQRPGTCDPRRQSRVWISLVQPVLDHVTSLVEDATSRGEVALAPALALRNHSTKADLRNASSELNLSFSLTNRGRGHAHDVSLRRSGGVDGIQLTVSEPAGPFDVPPNGEQLVRLRLVLDAPRDVLDLPIEWVCQTSTGKQSTVADRLEVSQQVTEPDWEALLASPPYSLNPIRRPDRLYGRDSSLRKLRLAAMAGLRRSYGAKSVSVRPHCCRFWPPSSALGQSSPACFFEWANSSRSMKDRLPT